MTTVTKFTKIFIDKIEVAKFGEISLMLPLP